jgi:branched-chain amino acid transport system permease protein
MLPILLNGVFEAAIILLAALGFSLIYGTARFFHLAHGSAYMLGGYAAYLGASHFKLGLPLTICLALTVSGVTGLLMELTVYKFLRKRRAPNLIFLISSLGLLLFFQNLVGLVFGNENLVLSFDQEIMSGWRLGEITVTGEQRLIAMVSALATLFLFLFLKSPIGLSLRALADNKFVARAIGINVDHMMFVTFFVGSALGGLAGALVAMETTINPAMGFSGTLYAMLACIIGGAGNLPGAILGAGILGMLNSLGVALLAPEWKDSLALGILLIVLFIKPQGLLSSP